MGRISFAYLPRVCVIRIAARSRPEMSKMTKFFKGAGLYVKINSRAYISPLYAKSMPSNLVSFWRLC
jgi:hypothetical protein